MERSFSNRVIDAMGRNGGLLTQGTSGKPRTRLRFLLLKHGDPPWVPNCGRPAPTDPVAWLLKTICPKSGLKLVNGRPKGQPRYWQVKRGPDGQLTLGEIPNDDAEYALI